MYRISPVPLLSASPQHEAACMSSVSTSPMSGDKSFPPTIPTRLRRNGTRPSCENCRIAKARCDHNAPCSRCSRTGKTCYFHPAPMSGASRMKRPSQKQTTDGEYRDDSTRKTRSNSEPAPVRCDLPLQPAVMSYSRRPSTLALGYMGSTSHAAILAENGSIPFSETLNDVLDDGVPSTSQQEAAIKFGMNVLAWYPPIEVLERLFGDLGFIETISCFVQARRMQYFVRSFIETFVQALREPRKLEKIHELSATLVRNTKSPLPIPNNNEEWLNSTCGANSRWEFVGQVFAAMGGIVISMADNNPLLQEILVDGVSKKSYAISMLECADSCLLFSDQLAAPSNLPAVTLLQNCVQLQSVVAGDTGHELWKRIGLLVAAVTGLGLHLKITPEEYRSPIYFEERTRIISSTMSLDKQLATFMGRPPLLSHRYAYLDLPLDVTSDQLWQSSDVFSLQQHLDPQGWNLEGHIYRATKNRASMILLWLRDEILELSLTINKPPDLSDQIDRLRSRMEESYNNLPYKFHLTINKALFSREEAWVLLSIVSTQLYHWQNIFLCERIQHDRRDESRLLFAARQMLSIVNMYWSERDRYPEHRDTCHWWICSYGIPAASALATDLWKQTVSPLTHPPSQARAFIIQDLHMFIASLEWIDEDCGNYKLCQRIRTMLNEMLIRILNPQSPSIPYQSQSYDLSWEPTMDAGLASFTNFDFEHMDPWFAGPLTTV